MKPLQCAAAFGLAAITLLNLPQGAEFVPQNKLLTADVAISSPFQPLYTSNEHPATSIAGIAQVCGLDQFRAACQTDAAGVRLAVIDSGLDIGLPEFAGADKLYAYADFTTEGRLTTRATSHHQQQISAQREIYTVGELPNALPQYKLANLKLGDLLPVEDKSASRAIMLTAQTTAGYDTIYMDTDNDHDFTDETPLGLYTETGGYLTLAVEGKTYHLLLADVAKDGSALQLSGDFLGHGTYIAGIIAADGPEYQGLAPKAQLGVYKIFDHRGVSDQKGLAQALHAAIADGADVINLSLSLPADEKIEPALLAAIGSAQAAGIPIVAAAGNYGASLGGLAFPANQPDIISAASYIAPIMQQRDLGLYLEEGFIPSYSARGNQMVQPTIIAPGAATSVVPSFFDERYMYDEGTSAAAAVTTAAAAHLQQMAAQNGTRFNAQDLRNLLALTASDLGQPNTDQGYGLLQMQNMQKFAAAWLRHLEPSVTVSGSGLAFSAHSADQKAHTLHWQCSADWLSMPDIRLKAGASTAITPEIADPLPPGHYSTWLRGIIDDQAEAALYLPVNLIIPYAAETFTNNTLPIQAAIGQGESRHYYLQIAPATKSLQVDLHIAATLPQNAFEHTIAQGRCRMQLYDPSGHLYKSTPYIGASYGDYLTTTAQLAADNPAAGLWQITVTSSDWLSMYNHFVTNATLNISAAS